eukprot:11499819-Prorocentrum_lima.AAC.1
MPGWGGHCCWLPMPLPPFHCLPPCCGAVSMPPKPPLYWPQGPLGPAPAALPAAHPTPCCR